MDRNKGASRSHTLWVGILCRQCQHECAWKTYLFDRHQEYLRSVPLYLIPRRILALSQLLREPSESTYLTVKYSISTFLDHRFRETHTLHSFLSTFNIHQLTVCIPYSKPCLPRKNTPSFYQHITKEGIYPLVTCPQAEILAHTAILFLPYSDTCLHSHLAPQSYLYEKVRFPHLPKPSEDVFLKQNTNARAPLANSIGKLSSLTMALLMAPCK